MFLSLLGFLCGYQGYRPLADFCVEHQVELRELLELEPTQRMPSYSTFRRCFLELDPQAWIKVFNIWALATMPVLALQQIILDGKSIRCTSTGGNRHEQDFVSVVSAYTPTAGVLQVEMMHNRQCSEIHVAQQLIEQLQVLPPGQCFSLDALHTTYATADCITAQQQHYLLAVKQNRAHTFAAIAAIAAHQPPLCVHHDTDLSHGRTVHRQAQVFAPTPALQAKWPQLAFVGVIHRQGQRPEGSFQETVYYLGSADWTAEQLLQATRQHWQIENGLHWVKDVTFHEDDPPRRGGYAPVNWAMMHTFCITLVRRQGWRTVPQALRVWANQLHKVFYFLV